MWIKWIKEYHRYLNTKMLTSCLLNCVWIYMHDCDCIQRSSTYLASQLQLTD